MIGVVLDSLSLWLQLGFHIRFFGRFRFQGSALRTKRVFKNPIFYITLKAFFFVSTINALDPANQSQSGALGLTEDVWHQKYELRKDLFYLKYSFNRISIISLCSRYRVLDWNLAKNPNPWKKGTHLCRLVPQHGKDEDLADVKFSI